MRRTNNPFEDLHLTVNRKAVFEQYSDLGNKISSSKRIAILAQIVCAGYDMNKVVKRYLKDKVALKPLEHWRISEIEETFNRATVSILLDDLEKHNETKDYVVSDSIKVLFKKHFKHSDWKESCEELLTKETSLTTLQIAIDDFTLAVKEVYPKEIFTPTKIKVEPTYNIRQLLKAYLKKDQTEYQQISKTLGIDLDKMPSEYEYTGSGAIYKDLCRCPENVISCLWHGKSCDDALACVAAHEAKRDKKLAEHIAEERKRQKISPQQITTLSKNEIFVFGSNLAGHHGGGAARLAMDWGAIWGQGVGLQGQTYAIPTMFDSVEKIKPYVDEFLAFAKEHSELEFLVTEIGCGIAGWTVEDIAPLFCEAGNVENVYLPERFWQELTDSKPQVPIEKSYMVEEKRLYAGEYPRDKEDAASIEKVSAFVAFGITDFIDLTDKEDNLLPYKQLLPANAGYYNFPIPDQHAPKNPAYMDSIVAKIDELIGMERKVYVHCWGGVGRTGMVIACWLGHKGLTEKATFATFQKLRKHYPKSHRPLCVEQEEFIKQYILRDRKILE